MERAPDEFDGLGWISRDDVDGALERWSAVARAADDDVQAALRLDLLRAQVKSAGLALAGIGVAGLVYAVAVPVFSTFAVFFAAVAALLTVPVTVLGHRALRIAAYERAMQAATAPQRLGGAGGATTPAALPTTSTPTTT